MQNPFEATAGAGDTLHPGEATHAICHLCMTRYFDSTDRLAVRVLVGGQGRHAYRLTRHC